MYKLYLGDSAEVLKGCPDQVIDLVVTSPPYDNLRTYNGYTFDFEAIAQQLARVLKPGGVIVWVVNDATVKGSETGSSFRQALYFMSLGLNLHDTMIWNKLACPFPSSNRYYQNFEYMFVFSKGTPKSANLIQDRPNKWGGTKVHGTNRQKTGETKTIHAIDKSNGKTVKDIGVRFNIWDLAHTGKAGNHHPAIFPLQLALDHIQSWSNPGDIVLDPFLGSGTTGVAALQLGRHFRGIEISEEYLRIAEERIAQSGVEICIQEKADTVPE